LAFEQRLRSPFSLLETAPCSANTVREHLERRNDAFVLAEIHGKTDPLASTPTDRSEDLLTDAVFGTLRHMAPALGLSKVLSAVGVSGSSEGVLRQGESRDGFVDVLQLEDGQPRAEGALGGRGGWPYRRRSSFLAAATMAGWSGQWPCSGDGGRQHSFRVREQRARVGEPFALVQEGARQRPPTLGKRRVRRIAVGEAPPGGLARGSRVRTAVCTATDACGSAMGCPVASRYGSQSASGLGWGTVRGCSNSLD
jgi:hypothetical protein